MFPNNLKVSKLFLSLKTAAANTSWYQAGTASALPGAGTPSVKSRHCVKGPHLCCARHLTPLFLWLPGTESAAETALQLSPRKDLKIALIY